MTWMNAKAEDFARPLAERIGGHPADMGWESQAVMLVPANQLMDHLNNPHDWAIVDAIKAL